MLSALTTTGGGLAWKRDQKNRETSLFFVHRQTLESVKPRLTLLRFSYGMSKTCATTGSHRRATTCTTWHTAQPADYGVQLYYTAKHALQNWSSFTAILSEFTKTRSTTSSTLVSKTVRYLYGATASFLLFLYKDWLSFHKLFITNHSRSDISVKVNTPYHLSN